MTESELKVQAYKDRHTMVLHDENGTPVAGGLTYVIRPDQTVDFLARFPVDSGEWRALPAMDMTDIDFTLEWGTA